MKLTREQVEAMLADDALLNSACMSYRHDFGLLIGAERDMVRFQAKEWLRAWQKAEDYTP